MSSDLHVYRQRAHRVAATRWVLTASALAAGMVFIDGTALNVALPALQADLGASGTELLWINNAYAVPLSALLLLGGVLGDRFGRKRIYMLGIGLFTVASLGCGVAPTSAALIAARFVQGIGGALLIPGSLAIMAAAVPVEERGRTIGTWSAISVVATALGPILGGLLARAGLWRGVFFINLPVAIVALTVLHAKVSESRDQAAPRHLDAIGALTAMIGLALVNFGLIEAPARRFADPLILIVLIVGVALIALFLRVEARSSDPLLPLELFRRRTFAGTAMLGLLFYSALNGLLFFYPLNLIQVQGYDAAVAGITQLPLMIALVVLSRWAGGLVDRHGPCLPLVTGTALAGIGFVLFARPGLTAGPADFWTAYFPAVMVLGVGMAFTVSPLSASVMASVPAERAGLASGMNSAVARMASVLGVAVIGSIALIAFSRSLTRHTAALDLPAAARTALVSQAVNLADTRPPDGLTQSVESAVRKSIKLAFVDAFRIACGVAAALAWLSSLLAAVIFHGQPSPRPQPESQ